MSMVASLLGDGQGKFLLYLGMAKEIDFSGVQVVLTVIVVLYQREQ